MADRNGVVIHEPPSPTNPHVPDVERERPPPPCVACGAIHGGVGAERICLRAAVTRLKAEAFLRQRELALLQRTTEAFVRETNRKIEGLEGMLRSKESKP